MNDVDDTQAFEAARPRLLGLAYRILGSQADAEDAVQDTFLKWSQVEKAAIETPAAWLTTACTRRCLDMVRAAHKTRVDYVGTWLPEPIDTSHDDDPALASSLANSLSTAFLLMLERLTPKERAAYLLHDIFDVPYPEIAKTLELAPGACRQLVSRARSHIEKAKVRHTTPPERQGSLLAAFESAIASGTAGGLAALLSEDVQLATDSGGKAAALREVLHGKSDVLAFIIERLHQYWADYLWVEVDINGGRGMVLRQRHTGIAVAAVSFAYDEASRATNIYIMRNPEKLSRLNATKGR